MPPSPAPDACQVYLVRHGATDNNLADPPRLQGRRSDLGLSSEGQRQARLTGQLLAGRPLAAVFSSPLKRAWETAEHIAAPHGLPVASVAELIEADVGDWEGESWRDIARNEPEAHRRFVEDPATYGYRGGENLRQVLRRVAPAMQQLMAANVGREIAVVGHNVVNRAYLASLLHVPLAKARSIPQDNCGVNVLRYRNGEVKVRTANAVFHLPRPPKHEG